MATSYNGWPVSMDGSGINRAFNVNGLAFPGGVREGAVSVVMTWLVTQLVAVEAPIPGTMWGWEPRKNVNNPSVWSNHASGTAIDYNAEKHGNGVHGTWSVDKIDKIRGILAQLNGVIAWGEDYSGTIDGMHFEIDADESTVNEVASRISNGQVGGSTGLSVASLTGNNESTGSSIVGYVVVGVIGVIGLMLVLSLVGSD